MSQEKTTGNTSSQAEGQESWEEEEDVTIAVRPQAKAQPTAQPPEEDEDATVAVRLQGLQGLLNDERLNAPKEELPSPPRVALERPDTETAHGKFSSNAEATGANLRNMSAGSLIGVSLVVSIVVGTALGWLVDKLMGNTGTPWGLIVGFFLGVISGFGSVVRISNQLNKGE